MLIRILQISGKVTFWSAILSVLAAMIGIQRQDNRDRDFQKGSPALFIAVGILLTVLFVLLLIGIVHWVLP